MERDLWERELAIHRSKRDEALNTAGHMRDDENARLVYLQRALRAQEAVVEVRNKIVDSYAPCKACQRKVRSPCHDMLGYRGEGPWDYVCREIFEPAP